MGRAPKSVKKDAEYTATVQITTEAKNRLVAWLEANNRPQQRVIVGRAVDFCISAPEEVQHFVFHGVPKSLKAAYANAIRVIADDIDGGQSFELAQIPSDVVDALKALAKADDVTISEYLRRHTDARSSSRVTASMPADGHARRKAAQR